jgi:uncharacterized protein (TIGR00251 family)
MEQPDWLQQTGNDTLIRLKVQPRARRNAVGDAIGGELKVMVTAPPVDSAANEALLQLLAELLEMRRGALQLVHGHTARHKTVRIHGMTPQEVARRLGGP